MLLVHILYTHCIQERLCYITHLHVSRCRQRLLSWLILIAADGRACRLLSSLRTGSVKPYQLFSLARVEILRAFESYVLDSALIDYLFRRSVTRNTNEPVPANSDSSTLIIVAHQCGLTADGFQNRRLSSFRPILLLTFYAVTYMLTRHSIGACTHTHTHTHTSQ
jgi:hypothetical protein